MREWRGKVDIFLECFCFFFYPMDVDNLISASSGLSKSSMNIWKLLIHVLLKSSLENFEHCFSCMWNEQNWAIVWTFFGSAFLCDWNEKWPFPVLWPVLSFPNFLYNPKDCSPPSSSVRGDSLGKNTAVGCHVLLQGVFPDQRLKPGLPHYRQILYCLSHQGSPSIYLIYIYI